MEGKNSPWGKIDQSKVVAEGITQVSTAGHGGFKLDRKRNSLIPVIFRKEGGWYEEDCEWAIVALFFPNAFSEDSRHIAVKTVKDFYPDQFEKHFEVYIPTGDSYEKDTRQFAQQCYEKFVVTSAWGDWHHNVPKGMVGVYARKDSTNERKYFLVTASEYADRNHFGFVVNENVHQEIAPLN